MAFEAVGLILNSLILIILVLQFRDMRSQTESLAEQTRLLTEQTKLLCNNVKFESYLKQVEQLNAVNASLIDRESLAETFKKLDGFEDILVGHNMSEIAFAWLVINRYESAYVGWKLGIIPEDEWDVWQNRIRKDFGHEIVRDVWKKDLDGFDYSKGFKNLVNELLARRA